MSGLVVPAPSDPNDINVLLATAIISMPPRLLGDLAGWLKHGRGAIEQARKGGRDCAYALIRVEVLRPVGLLQTFGIVAVHDGSDGTTCARLALETLTRDDYSQKCMNGLAQSLLGPWASTREFAVGRGLNPPLSFMTRDPTKIERVREWVLAGECEEFAAIRAERLMRQLQVAKQHGGARRPGGL